MSPYGSISVIEYLSVQDEPCKGTFMVFFYYSFKFYEVYTLFIYRMHSLIETCFSWIPDCFACLGDGLCIENQGFCDMSKDCPDYSDEKNCGRYN